MPKYFDIHSHLNSSRYDDDREEVIRRMQDAETHTVVVGTDLEMSKKAVKLAEKYEGIYATIGIHPTDKLESFPARSGSAGGEAEKFESLAKHPKVVAVGECGLDFFHAERDGDYERQKKLFTDQIEFAIKHDLPLMIHARPTPGTMNAYEDVLEILGNFPPQIGQPMSKLRGNAHFFVGTPEIAEKFFNLGFTVSFTGVITFTHDYDDVIKKAPLDKIMSETDAPYVAPVPHRGKRNEPSFVSEVVKRVAEIKGLDEEHVRNALVNNALNMIG